MIFLLTIAYIMNIKYHNPYKGEILPIVRGDYVQKYSHISGSGNKI